MKPRGYWANWGNLKTELSGVIQETNHFPSQPELRKTGKSSIARAISLHGGFNNVRKKMGYDKAQRSSGYWADPYAQAYELLHYMNEHGMTEMPSTSELNKNGMSSLVAKLYKHPGGPEAFAHRLGIKYILSKVPKKSLQSKKWIKAEAERIMQELEVSEIPAASVLQGKGYNAFYYAAKEYHNGLPNVRRMLGQENVNGMKVRDKRFRDKDYCIKLARKIIEKNKLDNLPSSAKLIKLGYTQLSVAIIDHHGGYKSFREALGLPPNISERIPHNEKDIVAKARKVLRKHALKKLPPHRKLFYMGEKSLAAAIINSKIGFNRVRELLGEKNIRVKRNTWTDMDYVLSCAEEAVKLHGWGELPGQNILNKCGYGSLVYAIYNYHGGLVAFREMLNEIMGTPSKSQRLEDFLEEYANGDAA